MTSLKKVNFEPNISQEIDVLSLLSNTSDAERGKTDVSFEAPSDGAKWEAFRETYETYVE